MDDQSNHRLRHPRYASVYRDLAAALGQSEEDIAESTEPASEYSAPDHQDRSQLSTGPGYRYNSYREESTVIDPFADELEQEPEHDPVGLRGLQWLRRNVSGLRVTVSLQRGNSSQKPRKPSR